MRATKANCKMTLHLKKAWYSKTARCSKYFTPTFKCFYTDISVISVTFATLPGAIPVGVRPKVVLRFGHANNYQWESETNMIHINVNGLPGVAWSSGSWLLANRWLLSSNLLSFNSFLVNQTLQPWLRWSKRRRMTHPNIALILPAVAAILFRPWLHDILWNAVKKQSYEDRLQDTIFCKTEELAAWIHLKFNSNKIF